MTDRDLEHVPGFRRRIRVTPESLCVYAEVEDDYHHMTVRLTHDGKVITDVEAEMLRRPWTTCPGAIAVLEKTFTGALLKSGRQIGDKFSNCTHLYDIAIIASYHALDVSPTIYDILVSDPDEAGYSAAELRVNGKQHFLWEQVSSVFIAPDSIKGLSVFNFRPAFDVLPAADHRLAAILRWGIMLAHGRQKREGQSFDKAQLPLGRCYTFSAGIAEKAEHIENSVRDFSLDMTKLAAS